MFHESLDIKEFTIKESEGFRLKLQGWESTSPKGLYSVNFIQESLDEEGKVWQDSTYNFHMTKEDIATLCQGLSKISS